MPQSATPLSQASDAELARISAQAKDYVESEANNGIFSNLKHFAVTAGTLGGGFWGLSLLRGKKPSASLLLDSPITTGVAAGLMMGIADSLVGSKTGQEVATQAKAGLAAEHLLRQRAEAKLAEAVAQNHTSPKADAPSETHAKTHHDTPEHTAPEEKKHEDAHPPKHDAAHPHATTPEAHHDQHNKVHAAKHEGTVAGHAHAQDKGAGTPAHM